MTVFEKFKSKNIDELAEWFDKHCKLDTAPWWDYWDKNYCSKCESEITYVPDLSKDLNSDIKVECAWCELNDKCKFFKEMDKMPDEKEIIKMWLVNEYESEVE